MSSNDEMADMLKTRGHIRSERIKNAFRDVDRGDFVDEGPYVDRPYMLKRGSSVSAPHIVAEMLELLRPEGRVLEMGCGSGYVLALLTELADEVVGVEVEEELVKMARDQVSEAEVIHSDSVPDRRFDRIIYSFAVEDVNNALEQADVVVAPVLENGGQFLYRFENGESENHGRVRFVQDKSF